jgi:hypothetical protein
MGVLDSPNFWQSAGSLVGTLVTDGSLRFVLLDKTYQMEPLIRTGKRTFTDFLSTDSTAKKCQVIVNGNIYGLDLTGKAQVYFGNPDDPSDTEIQGYVVKGGRRIAGDSRPQSFWFGQMTATTGDAWGWSYRSGQGDPPTGGQTLAAIGGAGPLIISSLQYSIGNVYKPGAPATVSEPAVGPPPASAVPYLIQRNNATFQDASNRPPQTGKTILAYCGQRRMLLVAVQPDGASPGQTHANLAHALAQRGFDSAVFLDGSTSATLVVDGKVEAAPAQVKNDSIDVGIGFHR